MIISNLHKVFIDSSGVITDTRSIKKGSVFFALKGGNFNGNEYAMSALNSGASYAVVDEFVGDDRRLILVKDVLKTLQDLSNYHRNMLKCPVLAIVGSNGKTTTKELTATVLDKKYNICFTQGNLNNHIGVPLTILSADLDCEFLLVEMGANHQREISFLCDIAEPDFGLLVNVGMAHLEGFGGIEGVKKGKTELYTYLNNTGKPAFFNRNELSIQEFKETIFEKVEYGTTTSVNITRLGDNHEQLVVEVEIENSFHSISSQLFGDYNGNNILSALAVGHYFGVEIVPMIDAIESYVPSNNRSELKISDKNNHIVLDAYNANPTSMANAIRDFSESYENAYYILGDMLELGAVSDQEHLKVLNKLALVSGVKFLVGTQFMKHQANFMQDECCKFYNDVSELLADLNELNISDSRVIVKGSRGIALEKTLSEL